MKELAIMSDVSFGLRDCDTPCVWFSVSWGEDLSQGSLIIITEPYLDDFLRETNVYDIKNLKGKPCQIEVNGNNIKFIKVLKNA